MNGPFRPRSGSATNQRLSVDCSESLFTSADWESCELNKPNVNRFTTVANCLFLQFEKLAVFLPEGPEKIGEEFLHNAETDIAGHGDTEAYSGISGGVLAWRKPRSGQECSCSYSANLGNGNVARSIVMARQDTAAQGVTCARPET